MSVTSAPLFEARNIHLWRGEKHLLHGVSFSLESGELLQLVGPNGIGKTSLLRAACGLLPIEAGEFAWRGKPIPDIEDEFRSQLAYLAHNNALKADLTVLENLHFELAIRGADSFEIETQLKAFGLAHCHALPASVLSAGQRRRLALARVVLCNVSIWILDEPTTNLDASGIAFVERLFEEHLKRGGAILAAAHHRLLIGHPAARTLELGA
jgi:heme exporter protein A